MFPTLLYQLHNDNMKSYQSFTNMIAAVASGVLFSQTAKVLADFFLVTY